MEKTIFQFRRNENRSREGFDAHYIGNHAPLGKKLTRVLLGYTVNLVDDEDGPDAITEHWLSDAMDLFTPDKAYASPEDLRAVIADDRSLFDGGMNVHIVTRESYPVDTAALDGPLEQMTPETKLIWFYPRAVDAPPPPAGARRVVDNHVAYKLAYEGSDRKQVAPDYELIRMAWTSNLEAVGTAASDAMIVREYRFIAAPRWTDRGDVSPI